MFSHFNEYAIINVKLSAANIILILCFYYAESEKFRDIIVVADI